MADPETPVATRLPCTFGMLTELSSADLEDEQVDTNDKLSITCSLARDSYVYILQIETVRAADITTTIWVMFPICVGPVTSSVLRSCSDRYTALTWNV